MPWSGALESRYGAGARARGNRRLRRGEEKGKTYRSLPRGLLAESPCRVTPHPACSLAIVTPTLGRSLWLPETVAGVRAVVAGIPHSHVLVAPHDRTSALAERWPDCTVFPETSAGVYGAINGGAAGGDGWRWMTWINDDDRLLFGFAALWRRAQAAPEAADVWYGDVDYIDEAGTLIAPMPVCRRPADVPALLAAGLAPFTQQGTLISAELWRRLGGIDASLRIAGDFDFWVRAAAAGARFSYVPERVAAFRVRPGQLSGDVDAARREVRSVLGRGALRVGRWARWSAIVRFRLANLSRILCRFRWSGRLGSRGLFSA